MITYVNARRFTAIPFSRDESLSCSTVLKEIAPMDLTKRTPQQLTVNAKKGAGNIPMKSRDSVNHWSILDEIEAPMWADLNLECDAIYEDRNNEWFHISHPYHQCSAQELISTFSCSLEHCSAFDIQEPSSTKLPPSVSDSRGKPFKSRKQEPVACSFTLNKQHSYKSLSSNSSLLNAESEKGIKTNAFDGKLHNHLNYKSDSVDESTLAEATTLVSSESVSSFSDKKPSAKPVALGTESNSIITSMSQATTGKLLEASNQPFGATSGLLPNLRESLHKSYITRQATRAEVKGIGQLDRKSASGKSSVGSSLHQRCSGMNSLIRENMEKTPDSRSIMTRSQLPTNKVYQANVHEAHAARAQKTCLKSDFRINREASKTMEHKKNKKCIILATAKDSAGARGINHSSRTVDCSKENQSGKIALGLKSSTRMNKTKSVCQRENCTTGSKVKRSIGVIERVYF